MKEQPKIINIPKKELVGICLRMSLSMDRTPQLWQSFMPRRKEILNAVSHELYSLQCFPESFDFTFSNPNIEFEKWALVEVSDFTAVPQNMETFVLPGGLYAVFHYKGLSSDYSIFRYIFGEWLPNSAYEIDHRPHFELLGAKYRNNDPDSEEEIWVPVRAKK